MEKYKPSEEETKKAENMMTPEERFRSERREEDFHKLKNLKKNEIFIEGQNSWLKKSVDELPNEIQPLANAVKEKCGKFCCLYMKVDETKHRVNARTCDNAIYLFDYNKSSNGNIELSESQPETLEEAIGGVVSSLPLDYDPRVTDKFVDEKKEIAVFVLNETLEKGVKGHTTSRGFQNRNTLYYIKLGEKPKILFDDHSYSGTPGYPGRSCSINDLKVTNGIVTVKHDTSETYSDESSKIEKLTFNIE